MPASHVIYPDQNVVIVTLSGKVTLSEVSADYMAYCAADDWRAGQSVFVDTSRVVDFRINFYGLLGILKQFVRTMNPKSAMVMTSIYAPEDFMFEKGKTHQRLTSGSSVNCVGVFRTRREAWAFLNVEHVDEKRAQVQF